MAGRTTRQIFQYGQFVCAESQTTIGGNILRNSQHTGCGCETIIGIKQEKTSCLIWLSKNQNYTARYGQAVMN